MRTARIILRRSMKNTLKKKADAYQAILRSMFERGFNLGRINENERIVGATANMEYGSSYPVPVDRGDLVGLPLDVPEASYDYPDADAIPR